MARINEICQAAQNYSDSMNEFERYHTYPRSAFFDGAKWADKTMIDKINMYSDFYMHPRYKEETKINALNQMKELAKMGKINPAIVKVLFKVVADDIYGRCVLCEGV